MLKLWPLAVMMHIVSQIMVSNFLYEISLKAFFQRKEKRKGEKKVLNAPTYQVFECSTGGIL